MQTASISTMRYLALLLTVGVVLALMIRPSRPLLLAASAAVPNVEGSQFQVGTAATNACTDDTWRPMTTTGAPTGRIDHTVVWSGSEMIVWGGYDNGNESANTGGRYDPATDQWTATSTADAPQGRRRHSAVWTGSEMIVWGGYGLGSGGFEVATNTGGRYNPATDSWSAISELGAPSPRTGHSAIWTGSEMIIWGGYDGTHYVNDGFRYNPNTDSWSPISVTNAPTPRYGYSTIWTGSEMIIWGGSASGSGQVSNGSRYNPTTDSWRPTTLFGAPTRRTEHSAIWTGSEMIIWGGEDYGGWPENTGARYNPATDSWLGVSLTLPPSERNDLHTAVWTGSEMIVWGGVGLPEPSFGGRLNTGGRYHPATDSWLPTTLTDAPTARRDHTAIWTGSEMLIWGGSSIGIRFNTVGGAYCAQARPANTPPITGVTITRQPGSPATREQLATVYDAEDAANTLAATVNGGASATVNGVTISDISANEAGVVTALVRAATQATNARFTLRVTDSGGQVVDALLNVLIDATATPTHTPVPPTATSTHTPVSPTPTATNTPPTPTATATNPPIGPTPTSIGTLIADCGSISVYRNAGGNLVAPGWTGTLKVGTSGKNTITGTSGRDLLLGLDDNDKLDGKGGDDLLCGGDGVDLLTGAAGNDQLYGGTGNDVLNSGTGDYDTVIGGDGNDTLLDGDGVSSAQGGPGNDIISIALRSGWRNSQGQPNFDGLIAGYANDTVGLALLDTAQFFLDISGDERDDLPNLLEGQQDRLMLAGLIDPYSTIIKFESQPVITASTGIPLPLQDFTIDPTTLTDDQGAEFLSEPAGGEEPAEEGQNSGTNVYLPLVRQ
jgi:N-acetylneuraminic acid mutarotase